MRKPRAALVFAGLVMSAAMTGALHALTVLPWWAGLGVGIALASRARKADAADICVGVLLGLSLPDHAPSAIAVVARPIAGHRAGDIFSILDQLDADPQRVLDRRISVSGEWTPAASHAPASVSRRVMTCCAADAVAVGFDIVPMRLPAIAAGEWVCVSGKLASAMTNGELRYRIVGASVRRAQLHEGDKNVLGMAGDRHLRPHLANRPGAVR